MKKSIALASTLAILGTFAISSSAHAGVFSDAFNKIKEGGAKLIERGKGLVKPYMESLEAKAKEWKERAVKLTGPLAKKWKIFHGRVQAHLRHLRGNAKKIKFALLKKFHHFRDTVIRPFWVKATAAVPGK